MFLKLSGGKNASSGMFGLVIIESASHQLYLLVGLRKKASTGHLQDPFQSLSFWF